MALDEDNLKSDPLDEATARRLASLRTMPVDLSRLTRSIETAIPRHESSRLLLSSWFRPARFAVASVILFGVILALVIASATGPALASADRLAAIHLDSVEAHTGAMEVNTISAAGDKLKAQWPKAPTLPSVSGHEVRACCIHHLDRKQLACVTLQVENLPVTLAIADASDVKCPHANMVMRNGINYCVMNSGNINVVMWVHQNRWVSLISRLSTDKLLDVAENIQF